MVDSNPDADAVALCAVLLMAWLIGLADQPTARDTMPWSATRANELYECISVTASNYFMPKEALKHYYDGTTSEGAYAS